MFLQLLYWPLGFGKRTNRDVRKESRYDAADNEDVYQEVVGPAETHKLFTFHTYTRA